MLIDVCPTCQQRRVEGERFCWHCQRDFMKRDDTECYECGAPLTRTGHESFDPYVLKRRWNDVVEG